jgi:hypothetical protein
MENATELSPSSPRTRSENDGRSTAKRKKDALKSRTTNGSQLLPGVDGRSAWVRRCKDIINLHLADLGGANNCSAAEHSIIRRASVMTVELEHLEAKFANAGVANPSDLDLYFRGCGNLRRLLEGLGLERRARDVTTIIDGAATVIDGEARRSATSLRDRLSTMKETEVAGVK